MRRVGVTRCCPSLGRLPGKHTLPEVVVVRSPKSPPTTTPPPDAASSCDSCLSSRRDLPTIPSGGAYHAHCRTQTLEYHYQHHHHHRVARDAPIQPTRASRSLWHAACTIALLAAPGDRTRPLVQSHKRKFPPPSLSAGRSRRTYACRCLALPESDRPLSPFLLPSRATHAGNDPNGASATAAARLSRTSHLTT